MLCFVAMGFAERYGLKLMEFVACFKNEWYLISKDSSILYYSLCGSSGTDIDIHGSADCLLVYNISLILYTYDRLNMLLRLVSLLYQLISWIYDWIYRLLLPLFFMNLTGSNQKLVFNNKRIMMKAGHTCANFELLSLS